MMIFRTISRHLSLMLVGTSLLILAACSSPGPPENAATSEAMEAVAKQGTEEFGMTKEELVKSIEAVEPLIAECMENEGFEYLAVDYSTVRKGMTADKTAPGLNDEQYSEQYGFGLSTLYTGLAPQLGDASITPARVGLGEENVRLFSNLSAADRDAYTFKLFGDNPDQTFAVGLEAENFGRTGGCTRAAIEQVFTEEQMSASYYNIVDELMNQDRRMITALETWSTCMAEDGFDYNHPDELEISIVERLETITEGVPVDALSPTAESALTELQGEERAIAVKNFECEEEHIEPISDKIEKELFGR